MNPNRVIVIGSLNYDLFLNVKALPRLGETYPAEDMHAASGGKGANQAVQCARLGMETVMVGAVGTDAMGDFLLERLTGYGVNTEYVRRAEGPSGLGVVHVLADGGVFSTIARGANGRVSCADVKRVEPLMRDAYAVLLQLEIPEEAVEYAIQAAARCGTRVLLNAAPARTVAPEALRLCDTVMVNEVEASFYTGRDIAGVADAMEAIVPFATENQVRVVFTLGEKGAVASDGGQPFHVPAVPTNAVETTGAGDSFAGGYVKACSCGLSFADAVRFAARCSAFTVSQVGGQDSMPTLNLVEKFLKP